MLHQPQDVRRLGACPQPTRLFQSLQSVCPANSQLVSQQFTHRFLADHLNGLDYKGYTLSASADNSTRSVYIWDQKRSRSAANFSSSSSSCGAAGAGLSPYASAAPGLDYGYYTPANGNPSPAENNACYGYDSGYSSGASSSLGYPYPVEQASQTVTTMAPDFTSSQQHEGIGSSAGSWYPHHPSGSSNHHGVDYGYDYGYDHQTDYTTGEEVPQTVKVIVKNLSRHASPKELENYLLTAVGGRHMLQEDVRFPRQSSMSSSSGRQHAFLLFNAHSDALVAVSKLDKAKLLGLIIEARLATEMVLPTRGEPSPTSSCVPPVASSSATNGGAVGSVAATAVIPGSNYDDGGCSAASGHKEDPKAKRDKSHNLVVDGKSVYGHVKKAVEEAKARDRKHKHKK